MPDFTLSSFAHRRTRSTSPTKSRSSPPTALPIDHHDGHNDYHASEYRYSTLSQSNDDFEEIVLHPEPAVTAYNPTYGSSALVAEVDSTPPRASSPPLSRTLQRRFTKSFFDNCKLPLPPRVTRDLGIFGPSSPRQSSPRSSPSPSAPSSPTKDLRSQAHKQEKETDASYFPPTLTGDPLGRIKVDDKGNTNIFDDWFRGSSTPVTLGVLPTKSDPATMAETPSGGRHRKTTSQPAPSAASSFTAKLPAFLTGRSSATATNTARPLPNSVASLPDADLLTLDLAALIFPPNSTSSPPSPAALALLTRLQTALRTRTTALADALAETSAQADELDEAETRARHLKLQLDGMAARAAAQDAELQALRNDLDAERAARREEADARVRSIALVRAPPDGSSRRRDGAKRTSAATFGSDSGFESEDETYASSISSAARPGASSPTPTTMSAISEFSSTSAPSARPAPPHRQPSTFEKVLRGEREEDEGCTLCRGAGGAASTAWGVVGVLKAENRGLRRRVGELEGAVEGALGLLV